MESNHWFACISLSNSTYYRNFSDNSVQDRRILFLWDECNSCLTLILKKWIFTNSLRIPYNVIWSLCLSSSQLWSLLASIWHTLIVGIIFLMNILLNSKKTGFFCFIKHSGYGSPKTLCCLGNGKQGMDARLIHGCRVSIFLDTMCLHKARQGLTDVTVFIIYWMDSLVTSFCYFVNRLYCEILCLPIRHRVCLVFAVLTPSY